VFQDTFMALVWFGLVGGALLASGIISIKWLNHEL